MSCQKLNQQAEGGGGSVQNDAMETEEDRWSLGDEKESDTRQGRKPYQKHEWTVVHARANIDLNDAFRRAEKIMTDDFNIAGGIPFKEWPAPVEKKIGPWRRKSVS